MPKNKQWSNLSTPQKGMVLLLSAIQVGLLATALWDIYRRPSDEINGNKWLWTAVAFINYVGPLAYFRFGRKHS